jgi:hypothetical protein
MAIVTRPTRTFISRSPSSPHTLPLITPSHQLKESLALYNRVVDKCVKECVTSFKSKKLGKSSNNNNNNNNNKH